MKRKRKQSGEKLNRKKICKFLLETELNKSNIFKYKEAKDIKNITKPAWRSMRWNYGSFVSLYYLFKIIFIYLNELHLCNKNSFKQVVLNNNVEQDLLVQLFIKFLQLLTNLFYTTDKLSKVHFCFFKKFFVYETLFG